MKMVTIMRSSWDRIRHAILFEVIGLLLLIPIGHAVLGVDTGTFGSLSVIVAVTAAIWAYLFNLGFDQVMLRLTGSTRKNTAVRVLHAALFEGGMLAMFLPLTAWYLSMSLWAALMTDIGISGFYFVYAFAYNWIYDQVFPVAHASICEAGR
ncbi:putative membrane spanning protein [Granulibacter bethesdensis CGDNIH1]|uniref:Membrane spanning protein n=2 Tax=Granulibacter bethesdensis TaxID=364410 RepID=Q0BV69_GRABC|nr:putative membrane spanning protein [Granulibacter bethesdensis CGDNIH1]APH51069.1 putative membrane spanning protein [Granulibacter bethesdensis]APH63763.1 putative membrane spanning protein [Granulibacter bethesdensis]